MNLCLQKGLPYKTHIPYVILYSVIVALFTSPRGVWCGSGKTPALLLISFDGFRWDYLARTSTPNFDRVVKEGVYVTEGVRNVFTTSTLPNHWSMVTGLYTETHGIVENTMYDSVINKSYVPLYINRFAVNDPRFYDVPGVEPIWVTNQLQNQHGRSGSVMWWGAENAIKNVRPTHHMPYNIKEDDVYKIKTIVRWFAQEEPINLGLLYFPEPDHTAHATGPDSANVTRLIARADELLGILFDALEKEGLLHDMNIIITADHGFTSTSRDRLIDLDSFIDPSWYTLVHKTPAATIVPKSGYENQIYNKLKAASSSNHFQVFRKSDIPERLHYKHSTRVPAIVALPELGWSFIGSGVRAEQFVKLGDHGYDNQFKAMRPFFMARGPSFKAGYKTDTFEHIHTYTLMCRLLQLQPNPNNGTLDAVTQFLATNAAGGNYCSLNTWRGAIFFWGIVVFVLRYS